MKKPEMSEVVSDRLSQFAKQYNVVVSDLDVHWDFLMGCWTFVHQGIFFGVELDGYLHS